MDNYNTYMNNYNMCIYLYVYIYKMLILIYIYNTNYYLEEVSVIKLWKGIEARTKKEKAEGVKPKFKTSGLPYSILLALSSGSIT